MTVQDNATKIRNASLGLGVLCRVLPLAMPLLIVLYWTLAGEEMLGIQWIGRSGEVHGLGAWHRMAGSALMLLQAMPVLWGVFRLQQLFRHYAEGRIFGHANVLTLQALAKALIGYELASVLVQPLLAMVLTVSNPVGQRFIAIGFNSGSVEVLVTGCVLYVLSWVMDEARKLEEDLAGTV